MEKPSLKNQLCLNINKIYAFSTNEVIKQMACKFLINFNYYLLSQDWLHNVLDPGQNEN